MNQNQAQRQQSMSGNQAARQQTGQSMQQQRDSTAQSMQSSAQNERNESRSSWQGCGDSYHGGSYTQNNYYGGGYYGCCSSSSSAAWAAVGGMAAGMMLGAAVASVPKSSTTVVVEGTPYQYANGVYYAPAPSGSGYVVVQAPPGAAVTVLPPSAVTVQANGQSYEYLNGVFYQAGYGPSGQISYTVVQAPMGATVYSSRRAPSRTMSAARPTTTTGAPGSGPTTAGARPSTWWFRTRWSELACVPADGEAVLPRRRRGAAPAGPCAGARR
jgi:hypothetical protein